MSVDGVRLRALSEEIEDAVALWSTGRAHLRVLHSDANGAGVVLALLAAGAEKLLKLTLGFAVADDVGSWPDVSTMRTQWRHKIAELDDEVRALLLSRKARSPAQPFIVAVLSHVEQDRVREALFGALQAYAASGRFHNLDTLAGSEPAVPSPRRRWDELSMSLVQDRPDLLAQIMSADGYDLGRLALNELLDGALQWWQYALYRSWQHGLAGPEAKRWAAQLHTSEPEGLVLPGAD